MRREGSNFQSSQGNVRVFKKKARSINLRNVTYDRERRKKTKEKMLNALTGRISIPPPEPDMNNLTPCEDNEKFNISFDVNQLRYDSVLRRSVKTTEKARVFTKGNLQNELDDSSLDFTKSLNNTESNTYDQTNARASGDFDFSDFFKAFKEGILLKDIKEV